MIELRDFQDIPQEGSTLYGFDQNDIWLISRLIWHYDGKRWNEIPLNYGLLNGATEEIYGKSTNDFYSVGDAGVIAHWDGNIFRVLSSPTSIDLQDIFGDENDIYIAGTNRNGAQSVILRIVNGAVIMVDSVRAGQANFLQTTSVWLMNKDSVIAFAGDKNRINYRGRWIYPSPNPQTIYCEKVRGTGINNIWFSGSWSYLAHFNGSTWMEYPETKTLGERLYSLVVFDDFMFAAGHALFGDGTIRGVVIRGYRR